jgi:uncharacterized protein YndB with AHSA1/START domain
MAGIRNRFARVRYADCPTVDADILIDAPIERVWQLVTDIELPSRFSSEFAGATWLDDGPREGARFVGRNRHPAIGEWETTSIVKRFDPPHAFEWCVTDLDEPSAVWRFELEEEDGRVRLRQHAQMGPAPSGLSIAINAMPDKEERIVARRLEEFEANMRATLDGIKRLAEGSVS